LLGLERVGLSQEEIISMRQSSDRGADDTIVYLEDPLYELAEVPKLREVLHKLSSNHRDHWLGLMDGKGELGFWYNLTNGSSQWISQDETVLFKADLEEKHGLWIVPDDYDYFE